MTRMHAITPAFLLELASVERSQTSRVTHRLQADGETIRIGCGDVTLVVPNRATRYELVTLMRAAGLQVARPAETDYPPKTAGPPAHQRWCQLLHDMHCYSRELNFIAPGLTYSSVEVDGPEVRVVLACGPRTLTHTVNLERGEPRAAVPVDMAYAYLRSGIRAPLPARHGV
ncbi:hypothetical protein JT358_15225 [Micrococcales bacterium 31B]|nr:hypothetical protein [Micrococcales bacterium 31B]